jgi:HemY protein
LLLRAEALAASGQGAQAYGLLGALRQQQALPAERLAELEGRWAEAALHEAADANVLAERWETLPKPLKSEPAVVAAYADRAAALRWEDAAAKSLEQALDTRWDETLAARYGTLPIGRLDARRANAERWLQAHPASPALLLTLARLSRAQSQWPQAEDYLHRALAQGAGSEAWEEFGHGYAATGDDARARVSYANALRAARGESVEELAGRDLRQKIYDQAVTEERDEHGMPRLRE